MTKEYIGVKKVIAYEQEQDGKPGYAVNYDNGYVSWSPKDVFERAYFPLEEGQNNKLKPADIDNFIASYEAIKMGEKTTIVQVKLINGFTITESSSCVDPANYDHELGTKLALDRAKDKIWQLLGFVLQTAINGIK